MRTYRSCDGWASGHNRPEGVRCPPLLEYPEPPTSTVARLFVSWNPPSTEHFWTSGADKLHIGMRWVLGEFWQTSWVNDAAFFDGPLILSKLKHGFESR